MQASLRRCAQSLAKCSSIREYLGRGIREEPVEINAWIKTIRRQKHVSFVNLNDGSNDAGIQAVIPTNLLQSSGETTNAGLQTGASVSFTGRLTEKKGGRQASSSQDLRNNVELQVETINLVGECDGAVSSFRAYLSQKVVAIDTSFYRVILFRRKITRHHFSDATPIYEAELQQ